MPLEMTYFSENWQDLFGILFPATAGIFAGASMSGDLRNPSKSIPKGTLQGLLLTFVAYTMVILSMGATIKRESLYKDLNIIQDVCYTPLCRYKNPRVLISIFRSMPQSILF